eukprot:5963959-Pleurochrysis_carterae.AAC.1
MAATMVSTGGDRGVGATDDDGRATVVALSMLCGGGGNGDADSMGHCCSCIHLACEAASDLTHRPFCRFVIGAWARCRGCAS